MPETDNKIWAAYAKGVKPIKKAKPVSVQKEKSLTRLQTKPQKPVVRPRKEPSMPIDRLGPGLRRDGIVLDRRTEKNLRQGLIEIDARIDLHGMRQGEAHEALMNFIGRQAKAGSRCLLIITGKGRGGVGVLRSSLSGWLASSDHAARILAVRPAAIKHGGGGAFYVLLKKPRNEK